MCTMTISVTSNDEYCQLCDFIVDCSDEYCRYVEIIEEFSGGV